MDWPRTLRFEDPAVLFHMSGGWRFLDPTPGILGLKVLLSGDLEDAETFLDEADEVNKQSNNRAMEFVLAEADPGNRT